MGEVSAAGDHKLRVFIGLTPLIVGKTCPPPSWHELFARYWWAFGHSYMVPQFAAAEKPLDFLLPYVAVRT
jgi:hypothetical protein